jgi:hypothetical protein
MPSREPRASTDNSRNWPPKPRFAWDIYRAAARAGWIGQVIAHSADEAIETAAAEFNTDAWKLIAVRRYEIEQGGRP